MTPVATFLIPFLTSTLTTEGYTFFTTSLTGFSSFNIGPASAFKLKKINAKNPAKQNAILFFLFILN